MLMHVDACWCCDGAASPLCCVKHVHVLCVGGLLAYGQLHGPDDDQVLHGRRGDSQSGFNIYDHINHLLRVVAFMLTAGK